MKCCKNPKIKIDHGIISCTNCGRTHDTHNKIKYTFVSCCEKPNVLITDSGRVICDNCDNILKSYD